MTKLDRFIIFVAAFMALSFSLIAGETGTLSGIVVNEKGQPIAGAAVIITGPNLKGEKGNISNADGKFSISGLPLGTAYTLSVKAESYKKVVLNNILVSLDSITITLKPFKGPVCTLSPPLIDTISTTQKLQLDSDELEFIPLGRSYESAFTLTPGLQNQIDGNPSSGASSGLENIYTLEGLNITDPVNGMFGQRINANFIEFIDIYSSGLEAEYGTSTGSLINTHFKSGTNEFKGEFWSYYSGDFLTAKSVGSDFTPAKPESSSFNTYDLGFDFGGPIIRDKIWFFIGYNPTFSTHHASYSPSYISGIAPFRTMGLNYDSWEKGDMWLVKFDFRLNNKNHFELLAFGDPTYINRAEDTLNSYDYNYTTEGPLTSPPTYVGSKTNQKSAYMGKRYGGGYSIQLQYHGTLSSNFFLEAIAGLHHRRNDLLPESDMGWNSPAIYDLSFSPYIKNSPGFGAYYWEDRGTYQISLNAVYNIKRHEIKAGFDFEKSLYSKTQGYTGGYTQTQFWAYSSSRWHSYQYRYFGPADPESSNKGYYRAGFIQDRLSITDYFNLLGGLRWETQAIIPDTAYDVYIFGNLIHGEHIVLHNLSPRFGWTWDIGRNGRSKLFGFFGRYYERIPIGLANSLESGYTTIYQVFEDDSNLGRYYLGGNPAKTWSHLKGQYDDERSLGFSYEIASDFAIETRLIYRTMGRALEDISLDDGAHYILANPGPNVNSIMPKPSRIYKALAVTARNRFYNHWFFFGNYILSRARGNFAGLYDPIKGLETPNITMDYDLQYKLLYQNRYGFLPTDRTHQLKLNLGYKFDNGFGIDTFFNLASGLPISKVIDTYLISSYTYMYGPAYLEPRGSAGRLPTIWAIDLHTEFQFKTFWESKMKVVGDIFNLTNEQRPTSTQEYINKYGYGYATSRQNPRYARIGFKWEF